MLRAVFLGMASVLRVNVEDRGRVMMLRLRGARRPPPGREGIAGRARV